MTLILSGTDGLSDVDGSAATPAIRGTDANTGIFFPAADTIAFSEGGVEAMRIDSSGNVGIGTSSPGAKLDVRGNLRLSSDTDIQVGESLGDIEFYSLDTQATKLGARISAINSGPDYWGGNTSNEDVSLTFSTINDGTLAERMRIDSSGNLLFNSGYGSVATAYGCRAWVNFNGTGTVAIRASGNVSSITDLGTGSYRVNFTTAMPDANYSAPGSIDGTGIVSGAILEINSYATGSIGVRGMNNVFANTDFSTFSVAIFR